MSCHNGFFFFQTPHAGHNSKKLFAQLKDEDLEDKNSDKNGEQDGINGVGNPDKDINLNLGRIGSINLTKDKTKDDDIEDKDETKDWERE